MVLSEVSIRRPVFATMLNLVLVVFGLFSLPRLPVDQFPEVDFPVVTVSVVYPGADPTSVEQRVLKPLEDAVNGLSGLEKLSSVAYPSLGTVVLQFKLEKKVDQAAQEVRDKVFAATSKLPPEAKTPVVQKLDIGGAPILNIAMTGDNVDYGKLSQVAKDTVLPALQRVPGVAQVQTAGIRPREVQVYVNREKLASFGLTPADIIQSIQQENADVPAGKVQDPKNYLSLRVKNRVANGAELASLPVIGSTQRGLTISDVAEIKDTIAEEDTASFVDRNPTILLSIQKQAGTSTNTVADETRVVLAKIATQIPAGVKLEVVTDNSKYIKGSIDAVKLDLVLGALLATVIVLIFLRDLRITIISALALPTAVIATFAFLDYMKFTLNTMSTLALSLSIGLLIDDAIIVIENIARHLSMGKSGPQAASDATSEIGLAVLATTLTICAVFVPVAFMEGIIGRFFFQFGLTITFAVAISLFVAFTLTPMLASRLLKEGSGEHHKPEGGLALKAWEAIELGLAAIDRSYRSALTWCLEHRGVTLAAGFATFVLSMVLLRFVPVAFFPIEDKGEFSINYTLAEGTTIGETKAKSLELVDAVKVYPGVARVVTAIAAGSEKKPNKAVLNVQLVPKDERNFSQFEFMGRMREELLPRYAIKGAELDVSETGGAGGGKAQPIQYIFKSDRYDELAVFTDKVADFLRREVPGTVDVTTTKAKDQREFRIEVDPARAADVGVSAAQIGMIVRSLFEGDKISEIDDKGNSFDVRLRIADQDRLTGEDLGSVTMISRQGQQLTLGSIARIIPSVAPSAISRFDGLRQITVLSNFTGKDLNGAVSKLNDYLKANMPPTISYTLSGQADIMKSSISAMLKALGLAVLLVFMILCAQYERYLAPLVIMAALPLSLTGAFGSLLLTGQVMSVYTMIGIILLMGIVTKNGILLIDFTMQKIGEGLDVKSALLEAGPIRLRPILMTTFAAGGGMIPIAIGHGTGGEARSPMGVAVIGGLLMSTLLTLVVVPCAFSVVEGARARWHRWRSRATAT
jgi:HAE1 family hydrophobic/amphiphilic exporter-1